MSRPQYLLRVAIKTEFRNIIDLIKQHPFQIPFPLSARKIRFSEIKQ